jgi:hypothetical protein
MNPVMKNRDDSRLRKAIRLAAQPTPLARKMLRHASWAGALTGKFRVQASLRAWWPQEFVYGLHSWRRLFFQGNLQKFQFEQCHSHTAGPVMNNFFLLQHNSASMPPAPTTLVAAAEHSGRRKLGQEQAWPPVLLRRERGLPIERIFSRSAGRPDEPVNAAPALYFHDAVLVRKRILRDTGGTNGAGNDVAAAIVRRVQRVEERPSGQSLDPVLVAPAIRFSRKATEPNELPGRRESNAGNSLETSPAMLPAAPFNITQLTDEVMRQLDRRLVATRERMGKI